MANPSKKRWLFPSVVIFALLIVSVYYTIQSNKPLTQTSVRLAWLHQTEHAGFYLAQDKGLYRKEGLEVRIEEGGREVQGIQAVLDGKEDFAVDSADQVLLARSKGQDVVSIGVVFRRSPIVLFAKQSSGIKSPRDFIGKTVGRKPGDAQDTAYLVMLEKLGVDRKRIKEVEIQYDLTPFYKDEVHVWNGFVIDEPIAAQLAGYPVNIIHPDDYGVHVYADVIVTKGQTLRTRPELVEKFLRASLKGWEYAVMYPDEAVAATLARDAKLEEIHQSKGMEAIALLVETGEDHIGWMKPEIWKEIHDTLVQYKFLEQPLNVEDAYTMDFLYKIYGTK